MYVYNFDGCEHSFKSVFPGTNDSNWHLSEVTLKVKTYLFKSHAMCRSRFVQRLDSEIVFSEAVWHGVRHVTVNLR